MTTLNVPVAPHIRPDGVPVSLYGLAPAEQVKLSGKAPTQIPSAPSSTLNTTSISAQWAVNLGFASLASVAVSGSTFYFIADFVAMCDPVPGKAGTLILNEYYGAGFRICIKVWDIKASFAASIQMVAAQCTAAGAKSSYEISFMGLGLRELGAVAPLIGGSVGAFDASAMERVGALMAATTQAIFDNKAAIRPVLFSVDIDPSAPKLSYAQSFSTSYALQSIWNHGLTLDQALSAVPAEIPADGEIDREVVTSVYATFARATGVPTSSQKERARRALFWDE